MPYNEVLGKLSPTFNKYWSVHQDGSLRNNGVEFVLSRPRLGAGISTALTSLMSLIGRMEDQPSCSQYTSTHVHLDVSQMKVYDYLKFLFVYRYFDEALTLSQGEHRYGNLYCLTFSQANGGFHQLRRVIEDPYRGMTDFSMERHKYGSCNLATPLAYGSLEFRAMGGCIDKDQALQWINTLCQIKMFAETLESWEDVLDLGDLSIPDLWETAGLKDSPFQSFMTEEQLIDAQSDIVLVTAGD
jgi:hypothetical protein